MEVSRYYEVFLLRAVILYLILLYLYRYIYIYYYIIIPKRMRGHRKVRDREGFPNSFFLPELVG